MRTEYDPLYTKIGAEEGVEPWVLKAIAHAESGQDWMAYRHSQGEKAFYRKRIKGRADWTGHRYYNQPEIIAASWGLMQVLYTTAIMYGFPREGCPWDLLQPETNVRIAARYLKALMDRWPHISSAVSAYNAGTPRLTDGGKFQNQGYVDKVMRLAERFRKDWEPVPA